MRRRLLASFAAASLLVAVACHDAGSHGLKANAGADQEQPEGTLVTLAGTAKGSIASVLWTQIAGPVVELTDADTTTATFTAPQVPVGETGELEFRFSVTSAGGASASDDVAVRVTSADFVVFVADKETAGIPELYMADVGTGTLSKLSTPLLGAQGVFSFAISPGGRYVAYWADQDTPGVLELYCARTDGSGNVKVSGALPLGGSVELPVNSGAVWSPDGTRVLYRADQDTVGVPELYVADADGSGNVKVNGTLPAGGAVWMFYGWAPDGSRIAYGAEQESDDVIELYTSLPDGSGNVRINPAPVAGGMVGQFYWSPDSTRLAFTGDLEVDGRLDLYCGLADGSGSVKLNAAMQPGGDVLDVRWAPDSSRVAYLADQDVDETFELFSVRPDGSDHARLNGPLAAGGIVFWGSRWSPDSSSIAYRADQDDDEVFQVYASAPDGSGNHVLNGPLVGGGDVGSFAWAPDGSRMAYLADETENEVIELHSCLPDGSDNRVLNGPLVPGGSVTVPFLGTIFLWAPDASRVAYLADQDTDDVTELFASRADGTGNAKLNGPLAPGGAVGSFAWSPDSSRVAWLADQDSAGIQELYLAAPDGSAGVKLSGDLVPGGRVYFFLWRP